MRPAHRRPDLIGAITILRTHPEALPLPLLLRARVLRSITKLIKYSSQPGSGPRGSRNRGISELLLHPYSPYSTYSSLNNKYRGPSPLAPRGFRTLLPCHGLRRLYSSLRAHTGASWSSRRSQAQVTLPAQSVILPTGLTSSSPV